MADPKKLQVLGSIKGEPGRNGATYKPAIDDEGNLTWTNDQGLDNPPTVNLKGPAGPDGYSPSAKVETIDSGVRISITDKEGTTTADIPFGSGGSSESDFETDETLTLKDGVLSVNTTDVMEEDNTLPITSAGVYATVGNIETLLKTI